MHKLLLPVLSLRVRLGFSLAVMVEGRYLEFFTTLDCVVLVWSAGTFSRGASRRIFVAERRPVGRAVMQVPPVMLCFVPSSFEFLATMLFLRPACSSLGLTCLV